MLWKDAIYGHWLKVDKNWIIWLKWANSAILIDFQWQPTFKIKIFCLFYMSMSLSSYTYTCIYIYMIAYEPGLEQTQIR
jgi:hypothetical protein